MNKSVLQQAGDEGEGHAASPKRRARRACCCRSASFGRYAQWAAALRALRAAWPPFCSPSQLGRLSRTTSFTRRLRNDVRRARGAHRRLRPLKRRRRAERDVVRCLDRERSRPARWVRRWLCGAVGCRPSAVVDVRRERAWRAHRVLCRGQLRSLAERDGARRRARERERPAGGERRASHILHSLSPVRIWQGPG